MCNLINNRNIYFILILIISIVEFRNCLDIVPRDEWLASPAKADLKNLTLPVHKVIISHTASDACNTLSMCTFRVRYIQTFHMESRNFDDIAYNFLVGGDGSIFEGRGWDKQGAHTKGYNSDGIGISFIGTFDKKPPSESALDAVKKLIANGVEMNKISKDYELLAHRQLASTNSPGDALFEIIKTWPHFSNI